MALFIALGGVSYAAIKIPTASVGTKQLKNKSVAGKKIKKDAVTGAKVKNRSLKAIDFAAGQLPSGATGPAGDAGTTGAAGQPGADGIPAAIARTVIPVTSTRTMNVNSYNVVDVGTFIKQDLSSRVDLTYATDLNEDAGCRIQLRIDGADADGETGLSSATVTTIGDVRLGGGHANNFPAIAMASFAGLAPGSHTVAIAVASSSGATTCTDNASGIDRGVVVDEVPPVP
ncbi:MAG: collagen-like protein [Solirubrobacterales bacterium]